MSDPLIIARAIFSTLNMALLGILFWLFWTQYRKLRSQFTLGLLLVVLALLFHTAVMNPAFHNLVHSQHLIGTFGLLALAADLFEAAALAVLLHLSWK